MRAGLWRGALTLPLLYIGVVLLAICAANFLGAQASSIPFLLGKDRAKAAVAALVATEQGVNLIAPRWAGRSSASWARCRPWRSTP